MKDKLKIMFYGNCQLASIGKFFYDNLQNEFELVSCEECDVIPDTFIKGHFHCGNLKIIQSEFCDCILSLCSKVDVFVFQSHSGSQWIDNLKTEYICNNILKENSMHICVPDCRFMVHTTNFHILKPWIEYAKEIHTDPNQIIDFLIKFWMTLIYLNYFKTNIHIVKNLFIGETTLYKNLRKIQKNIKLD